MCRSCEFNGPASPCVNPKQRSGWPSSVQLCPGVWTAWATWGCVPTLRRLGLSTAHLSRYATLFHVEFILMVQWQYKVLAKNLWQFQREQLLRTEEKPTRCHWMVYCTYNMLNMFRALLCPSSGAPDYLCVTTAYGVQCLVAGCRGSGAGQQAMRPGRGMLHDCSHATSLFLDA